MAALPLVPGGIGVVDGCLTVIVVAYGTHREAALAVVLFYWLVTFWWAALVRWISVGVIEIALRREQRRVSLGGVALAPPDVAT